MTSTRPYMLRAMFDWIVDNGMTPHIIVDAEREDVVVPRQHVQDGKIVFNISPTAVQGLVLQNDYISFGARFSGRPETVSVTPAAVVAIYARENGRGMAFEEEEEPAETTPPDDDSPGGGGKPSLRVVK